MTPDGFSKGSLSRSCVYRNGSDIDSRPAYSTRRSHRMRIHVMFSKGRMSVGADEGHSVTRCVPRYRNSSVSTKTFPIEIHFWPVRPVAKEQESACIGRKTRTSFNDLSVAYPINLESGIGNHSGNCPTLYAWYHWYGPPRRYDLQPVSHSKV